MKTSKTRALLLVALGAFICSLMSAAPAQAATLCVDPGGGGCYTTIQAAINAASSGDTILVSPGSYTENLNVGAGVTLLGAQANVDPNTPGARTNPALESTIVPLNPAIVSVNITAANATVNGFQVNAPTGSGQAILASAANDTVSYNIVDGFETIYDQRTDGFTAAHNRLHTNYVGVTVHTGNNTPATGVSVTDNVIVPGLAPVANSRAIYMSLTVNSQVTGNSGIGFIGAGLEGSGHTNLLVSGNTFNGNRKGISIFGTSTFITITGNTVNNNHSSPVGAGFGIDIKGQNLTITGNTITGNGDRGISISNNIGITQNVTVTGNTIAGNGGLGLRVDPLVLGPVGAAHNWWGCVLGPGQPGCDTVSGSATIIPWYTQVNGSTDSSDADITALTPDTGTLTPPFTPGVTSYTLAVPKTTSAVNFAVHADPGATWVIQGAGSIQPGDNPVTLKTTSADGTGTQTTSVLVRTIPDPKPQTPAGGCVTSGSTAKSIPAKGRKQLMKPSCKTNAGKTIGVRVNATLRGDVLYYRLYCKVSNTKERAVSKNSSGAYCKTGALYIKTYGYKLRLRITWAAPATGTYKAYKKVKTYTT